MIVLAVIVGVLLAALLLWPTLRPARQDALDTRRTELEEERDALLSGLRDLEAAGADEALQLREKVRLTAVLHDLDTLPPAPTRAAAGRPAFGVAAGVLLGVLALAGVGTATFLPQWRYQGMDAAQATELRNASRLPALAATAQRTGATSDQLALGDAAWDAQKYAQAAQAYTQVLLKDRDNARALRRVGFFLLRNKAMAQNGLSFIGRSVAQAPKEPEGYLLYGYGLGLFGQYDAGLKALDTYQKLAPNARDADDLIVEFQGRTGTALSGNVLFAQNCAGCHGAQAQGGTGPKLIGSAALQNDAALRQIILNGATGMPAFPQLKGAKLDALVGYLKGLE